MLREDERNSEINERKCQKKSNKSRELKRIQDFQKRYEKIKINGPWRQKERHKEMQR